MSSPAVSRGEIPSHDPRGESSTAGVDALPLTRIIATLGPASSSPGEIGRLVEEGASIFRLNFSHGTLDAHARRLEALRQEADRRGRIVAVMGDLQGPRIRVHGVPEEGLSIVEGEIVFLTGRSEGKGGAPSFSTTRDSLPGELKTGQRVLIADGSIELRVEGHDGDSLLCRVHVPGTILPSKGLNFPDTNLPCDSVSPLDWEHVDWCLANEVDFVALSFVRTAEDIRVLRAGIMERCPASESTDYPAIVAKIELPEAVRNCREITAEADVIMIARGDLGVEMDLAEVPVIQRELVVEAQNSGTPCIVATQMLESMTDALRPTRAEASDVAYAILDGVDAVMLSAETSIGRYPDAAVRQMRRIAIHTEAWLARQKQNASPPVSAIASGSPHAALAHGVWTAAHDSRAAWIGIWSEEGVGALFLSQNGFQFPIVAVTSKPAVARRMQIMRGVRPLLERIDGGIVAFTRRVEEWLHEDGRCSPGTPGIIVISEPRGEDVVASTLRMHTLPDRDMAR